MYLCIKQKQRAPRYIDLEPLDFLHVAGAPGTVLWVQGHIKLSEGVNKSIRWKDQQIYVPAEITLSFVESGLNEKPLKNESVSLEDIRKKLDEYCSEVEKDFPELVNKTVENLNVLPMWNMQVFVNKQEVFNIESRQLQFEFNYYKDKKAEVTAWSMRSDGNSDESYSTELGSSEITIKFSS